jgi:hypothetical protein
MPLMHHRSSLEINGVSLDSATSPAFEVSLINAVAQSLNISPFTLSIMSIITQDGKRNVEKQGSVIVTYTVAETTEAITAADLTNRIDDAISCGTFDAYLQKDGYSGLHSSSVGITISDPTHSPTNAPSIVNTRSFQIGVSIGVIVFFLILASIMSLYCCSNKEDRSACCCCCEV